MARNNSNIDSNIAAYLADDAISTRGSLEYFYGLIREQAEGGEYAYFHDMSDPADCVRMSKDVEQKLVDRGFRVIRFDIYNFLSISWEHESRLRRGK